MAEWCAQCVLGQFVRANQCRWSPLKAHRASFDPVVSSTIELSSPGVSTVDYASLPYKYIQRPIWPVDKGMSWSAVEAEAVAAAERIAALEAAGAEVVAAAE